MKQAALESSWTDSVNTPEPRQIGGSHYSQKTDPFALMKEMESSGDSLVDYCRGSVIKYAFRKKGDAAKMAEDLRKAAHCALVAAEKLESSLITKSES